MKKFICILISVMMVFSSISITAFSEDKDNWAYPLISGLLSDGVISGDENGNLNLDKNITRAEFAKTINKYFNLTKKAASGYPDVYQNDWYYDDMLIAKEAGYIKGDQNNNANPKALITRAESAVMIARLLNVSEESGAAFNDDADIPSWAKGAVNALTLKGVINGYNDGSFKPYNSLTRAEAFVIISRNSKTLPEAKENNTSSVQNVFIPTPSAGSSSGGGGGGGGGGGSSFEATKQATLSSRFFDKENKKVEFIAENASSYIIKFFVNNNDYVKTLSLTNENATYKYADISDLCDELISEVGINGFNADIYIKAIGLAGYSDSSYVKFGTIYLEFDIPDVTGGIMTYNPENDGYDLTWDSVEGVEGYKVALYTDTELKNSALEFETTAESYSIDTTEFAFKDTYYVCVTAKKNNYFGNPKVSLGKIVKGFGGGDGSEENPYLIYSLAHLMNVKYADDKCYFKQMSDITETTPVTEPVTALDKEFSGYYDGNDKTIYVNLSTDITTTDITQGFGLFPCVKGASFKNIILKGSVVGRGNVGSIAGRGTGKCLFENITNYAFVNTSTGFCGGVIARMYDGDTTGTEIKNCINYGEIKSFGYAGGIVGVSRDSNKIKNCANFGKVYSTNTNEGNGNAGGIIATAYGDISDSYNFGEVSANKGNAGGIAGILAKPGFVFENCFNAGEVSAYVSSAAIVTSLAEENYPLLKNSYNLNKNIKMYDGPSEPSYINCVTLNSSDTNDGLTHKTAAALSEMKLSDSYTLYEENASSDEYNKTFRYPQLSENLIPADFVYDDPNFKISILDISYDTDSEKWYVTINPTIKGEVAKYIVSLSGVADTVITEMNIDNKYELTEIPDGTSVAVVTAYDENDEVIEASEDVSIDFTFSGGTGTDEKPYIITNAEQFEKAFGNGSSVDNGMVYLLTGFDETPLELSSDFKPLGVAFTGKLIGGDYVDGQIVPVVQKINFNITTGKTTAGYDFVTSGNYKVQGIIFHQLNGATIKNIAFYGSVNTPNTPSFFGVLAGNAVGTTVENVHNYASIDGDQQRGTGGVIGWTGGNCVITNCSNSGDITIPHNSTARSDVGGIIGNMTATVIKKCYNYGDIQGRDNAGGIAGYSNCDISYCGNYGDISITRGDTYGYAGGISGRSNGGNISNCFNAGNITSVKYAGGIFAHTGSGKTSNITNCFNIGVIRGNTASGVAIGFNQGNSTVTAFYDLANPALDSVCGYSSGSYSVVSVYGYGDSSASQTGDIEKVTAEDIKMLIESDSLFNDSNVWMMSEGYSYPNLKDNLYVGDDFVTE